MTWIPDLAIGALVPAACLGRSSIVLCAQEVAHLLSVLFLCFKIHCELKHPCPDVKAFCDRVVFEVVVKKNLSRLHFALSVPMASYMSSFGRSGHQWMVVGRLVGMRKPSSEVGGGWRKKGLLVKMVRTRVLPVSRQKVERKKLTCEGTYVWP